ncbi:ABC transporter permease [Saccharopolyspora hattusasensis]|uniref:ABC transporter permease n=1 Tax=Saccharopolyspora hattusasensis TaxID=1128679 RepID=UPI003D97A6E9
MALTRNRDRVTAPRTGVVRAITGGLQTPGVAPTILIALLIGLWETSVRVFDVPRFLLPAPSTIAEACLENWSLLMRHLGVTLVETLAGFLISAVVGLAFAILMVLWPVAGSAAFPLLVASQVIPKVAVAPLMVVWIGTGLTTSAIIAFVMAFFPVVVNATLGLKSVEVGSLHLLQSMRATKWQQFCYLRFPTAIPFILSGLQLAIAFAIVGAIVGEFVGSNAGLGYLLIVTQGNLQTSLLFADLTLLTIVGLALYYGVELLGRLALRHRGQ